MKYERITNAVIWGITVLLLILSIIVEFELDRFFVLSWPSWISGHRDFAVNIALGGFASGVITGITTAIAFSNKKQSVEERVNRYLWDVQRYFDGYCDSISQKDYKTLIFYMEKFENAMTDFMNCIRSNDCKNKYYEEVKRIYCQKIISFSTVLLNYECIFINAYDGNIELLFADLSNSILIGAKDDFNAALNSILKNNVAKDNAFEDEEIGDQIDKIRKRYSFEEEAGDKK